MWGLMLWRRVLATGFRGRIKTLIIVENPGQPLVIGDVQERLAVLGATVLPGVTITV
jgi:hypothetical protein